MIQSPCRECKNRLLDKKICAGSCDRLLRVQMFNAGQMGPILLSAVNSRDEGRYRLAMLNEERVAGLNDIGW